MRVEAANEKNNDGKGMENAIPWERQEKEKWGEICER